MTHPDPVFDADYHTPVLLSEAVEQLVTNPDGIYVDATFGGGGHSKAILDRLGAKGHLFGIDRDLDAQAHNSLTGDGRFTFVRSDFRYIPRFMRYFGIDKVDGILADLGVSGHHLDDEERGFSFRFDAPIDMRMNQGGGETALELIRRSSAEEIETIIRNYGEARGARRMGFLLKKADDEGRLSTINTLIDAISPVVPPHDRKSLARVFQALRIAVNDEMGALRGLLKAGEDLIRPFGRFSIITYHSLEDRPVKNFFRTGHTDGTRVEDPRYGGLIAPFTPLSNKPTDPTAEEVERNPRSRSAHLRTAVRNPGK